MFLSLDAGIIKELLWDSALQGCVQTGFTKRSQTLCAFVWKQNCASLPAATSKPPLYLCTTKGRQSLKRTTGETCCLFGVTCLTLLLSFWHLPFKGKAYKSVRDPIPGVELSWLPQHLDRQTLSLLA